MSQLKNDKEIQSYYNSTHFEYQLIWNWNLKTTPALHFGYYDEKATKHAQAIFRINEVLADWADIKEGTTVLDAGCGLGNSTLWLTQHRKAKVIGITLVESQVEIAYKMAKKQNIQGAEFRTANYLNAPFEDESFEVVWAIESQCHTVDKSLFYKEAFRLLKPGGRLVIADSIRSSRQLNTEDETLLKNIFNAWAVPDIDTIEEHQVNAAKAGFINFEAKNVSKNMFVSYKNLRKTINKLTPLAEIMYRLRILSKIRYDNFKQSGKQADALEQDLFRYYTLLAHKPK